MWTKNCAKYTYSRIHTFIHTHSYIQRNFKCTWRRHSSDFWYMHSRHDYHFYNTMHMPDLDVLDCIISLQLRSCTIDYVVYTCHLPPCSIKSYFRLLLRRVCLSQNMSGQRSDVGTLQGWYNSRKPLKLLFFCFSWRYSPHIPSTDSYPRILTQEPGRRCGRSPVVARLQPPQSVGTSHISTSIFSRKMSKVSCSRIDWNVLNVLWKEHIKYTDR